MKGKTIIAGSRTLTNEDIIISLIREVEADIDASITEVVSGGAAGVDTIGEIFAKEFNLPIKHFIPKWGKYGWRAGPIRNREMAQYADSAIIFWDGASRGTANMIEEAVKARLKLWVFTL